MRAPPVLRGGLGARILGLVFGLFLCAAGIVALLESELGLSPWDVLHQGLAQHTPLSYGTANIAVGVVVLALAWALGTHVGVGTVANATLIGIFIEVLVRVPAVEALSEEGLAVRGVALAAGIALVAVGSAFYLGAAVGAGPRDSLMLVTSRRLGVRLGAARTGLEIAALVVGFLLGGTVGIGTLVFAVGIGPVVEASFWLLGRTPLAAPAVASSAA
jgi:uncharacterized protein